VDNGIEGEAQHPFKTRPPGAVQHVTAGPYSSVLQVDADGKVIGDTIEE
jgi:2-iminobutanoate/2-iminopropanoate deaminase